MTVRRVLVVVLALGMLGACGGSTSKDKAANDTEPGKAAAASASDAVSNDEAQSTNAGSAATTAPKAEGKPPALTSLLLSAKDLGAGWRDRDAVTLDASTATLLRLCGHETALASASIVGLSQPKEGNLVAHLVARFDTSEQAKQAVQAVAEAGLSCNAWGTKEAHVKINPVKYGLAGEGRVAFRMIIEGEKPKANADYFVWHRGRYVEAILNAAAVLLDPKITTTAIDLADRRLVENG